MLEGALTRQANQGVIVVQQGWDATTFPLSATHTCKRNDRGLRSSCIYWRHTSWVYVSKEAGTAKQSICACGS